ncbi:hypothetical protein ACFC26_14895 [Kitasatospora purpeofusca]|uniref:hypothetical protein n=1 Tax=Kitasatospora purpeofusca TaxID=67352 RepID=UPI0035DDEC49
MATSIQRAAARALADAGAHVGTALACISRATAMAARLHEADGLDGPRADGVRARAGRQQTLALASTGLALTNARNVLRLEARTDRASALQPGRHRAAIARGAAAESVPTLTAPPRSAALPLPAAAPAGQGAPLPGDGRSR